MPEKERTYEQLRLENQELKNKLITLQGEMDLSELMLNSIGDAVIEVDVNGLIRFMNPVAEKLTGWIKHKAIDKKLTEVFDIVNASTGETVGNPVNKVLESGNIEWLASNALLISAYGKEFQIADSAAPIKNNDAKIIGVVLVFRDVSEEYRMQEKLKESEKKFRSIFENAALGIFRSTPEGRYEEVNEAFARILGFDSPKKMIEEVTEISELYKYPEDREKIKQEFAEKGFVEDYEIVANHPYKKTVWISVNAKQRQKPDGTIYYEGTVQDITERKLTEQKLRESREEISKILENSIDGILLTSQEGPIFSANPAACELLGRSEEELCEIGREGIIDTDNPELVKALQTRDEHGKVKTELDFLRKDGSTFPAEVSSALFKDKDGNLKSSMIIRDITERKKAEVELTENQEYLNSIYRAAPVGIGVVSNRILKDVNRTIMNMTGYSEEELIGKDSRMLYPDKKEYDRVGNEKYRQIKKNGLGTVETRWQCKDGHIIDVLLSSAPFDPNNLSKGVTFTALDITERKKAEKQLYASERRFRTLVDTLPEYIWLKNTEGVYLNCNQMFEEFFGHKESEIVGKTDYDFVPKELSEFFRKKDKEAMKAGKPSKNEEEVIRAVDSKHVILETTKTPMYGEDGTVLGVLGIGHDITERKKAEKEILLAKEKVEISEERFRKAQEVGHIGSWEYDLRDGTFWGSEEGKKIYNLNRGKYEFTQHEVMECVIEQDHDRVNQALIDLVEKNKTYDITFTIIPKNTSERKIIHSIAELQKDENGKPIKILGVLHDITVQKTIEKELITAKEKAEEADQLKSAFLANMSHEIRTPMNGILGFTSLLKEPALSAELQSKYIDIIQRSGERMLGTVNDLIDISKIETGQMTVSVSEVDVNEEANTLVSFFATEAKQKGLQLFIEKLLPEAVSTIKTDKTKFASIFSNLIKNAIKYTRQGFIKIGVERRSDSLLCYVKDTGIGVPRNRQQAIFNRFEQADIKDTEAFQGSGLGLAISKAYSEMLGGSIGVDSQEGKGSTFWFKLPAEDDATFTERVGENQKEHTESLAAEKPKILIAEDDEDSTEFFRAVLKHMAGELVFATTGKEVIDLCRNNAEIDVVLMDIKMPGADGYEATRKIREFNRDVVIIAQTAYAMAGDREKSLEAGCDEYIAKPVRKKKLIELIHQTLAAKNRG